MMPKESRKNLVTSIMKVLKFIIEVERDYTMPGSLRIKLGECVPPSTTALIILQVLKDILYEKS